MGITQKTPPGDITKELNKAWRGFDNVIVNIMNYVGLDFVSTARDSMKIDTSAFPAVHRMTKKEIREGKSQPQTGDYMDQTANLRNSIGYFLLKDGTQIRQQLHGGLESTSAAMTVLNSVPKKPGYQLIGIAGMDYASYLESQGFNVITSQAGIAMVNLNDRVNAFARRKGINLTDYADMTGTTSFIR